VGRPIKLTFIAVFNTCKIFGFLIVNIEIYTKQGSKSVFFLNFIGRSNNLPTKFLKFM